MTINEITVLKLLKAKRAEALDDTEVSKQREVNYKYYYGEPFGNEQSNRSKHVSREVFESVEAIKPELIEIFTESNEVCAFTPINEQDIEQAEFRTKYVNKVFHRKNSGFKLLLDVLHDGALSKVAVVKCHWDESIEQVEEDFEGVSEEQLKQLYMNPNFSEYEAEQDERTGLYSGHVVVDQDKSQQRLTVVPPENFYTEDCDELQESTFCGDKSEYTLGELKQKYPDKINEINALGSEHDENSEEEFARNILDDSNSSTKEEEGDREEVWIYEEYIKADLDGSGYRFWRIVSTGDVVFEQDEVDENPYFSWSPYMLSHRWFGLGEADLTKDLQKSNSSIKRGIIDNILISNTTRWKGRLSSIKNPRDLIDNPIGGIIDTDHPDSIKPVETPSLSPATSYGIELLQKEKESRTGSIDLGHGLNAQDAMSGNNADSMVERLQNAGNKRKMLKARMLAELMLKPILARIYKLGVLHDKQTSVEKINGKWVELVPSHWPIEAELQVSVALTPEESLANAQALLTIHQLMSQDEQLSQLYGIKQRYALFKKVLLSAKQYDHSYLLDPESDEFIQAQQQQSQQMQMMNQMQMQQQQMFQQLQAQAMQMQMVMAQREQDRKELETMEKLRLQEEGQESQISANSDKQTLEEDKHHHQIDKDTKEIELEERKITQGSSSSGVSIG